MAPCGALTVLRLAREIVAVGKVGIWGLRAVPRRGGVIGNKDLTSEQEALERDRGSELL